MLHSSCNTVKAKKAESSYLGRINMWCLDMRKKAESKLILGLVM